MKGLRVIAKYQLTPEEKETVIVYSESSNEVTIHTSSRPVITKLKKAGYKEITHDAYSKTFVTDKKFISFRTETKSKPKKTTRTLTEEHKQKMIEGRKKKNES
jgi:hypothetical protein